MEKQQVHISENKLPKVLVTNDDGINACGIRLLVEALAEHTEVYVAAPATQQSAKSQSVTFRREISAEKVELRGAACAFAIDGTPADCVKWGIARLAEDGITPDYVFSGINMGANLGMAAYYSGTIGAAREGAINGIRSIALSEGTHDTAEFSSITEILPKLMELSDLVEPSSLLSVNAPDLPSCEIKGIRCVEAAPYGYGEDFVFGRAESGNYQLYAVGADRDDRMRYDYDWIEKGYVTVSPIPSSLSDPDSLRRLSQAD